MKILKTIGIVAVGTAAFLTASVAVSLLSMVVGALIPGQSPDKPGILDPSPEEKIKAEWQRSHPKTADNQPKEQQTTTELPESSGVNEKPSNAKAETEVLVNTQEQTTKNERQSPTPKLQPSAVVTPTPPHAATGPGNFESPSPISPSTPASIGPGNF